MIRRAVVTWRHERLSADLAKCRRDCGDIVATELGLGSWGGPGRLDVASMRPSWSEPRATAYEVKCTRGDLLADIKASKWEKYIRFVNRVYFAFPLGLASKEEIPRAAGVMVRGPNGWTTLRAAPYRQREDQYARVFCQALLLKQQPGPWKEPNRFDRMRALSEAGFIAANRLELGARVASIVAESRDLKKDIDELKYALAQLAGVDPAGQSVWSILEQLEKRGELALSSGGSI